jgi:hypothetical protein
MFASRREERAVDFDDFLKCVDGSVFAILMIIGEPPG